MPRLVLALNGMALIGHGPRGEGWLIDTTLVAVGHSHIHQIRIGPPEFAVVAQLDGGSLVTFESDGRELAGALDLGQETDKMVDLDVVTAKPQLRAALREPDPKPGGPWTELLAAWIRLPAGTPEARADPQEIWDFPSAGRRTLTEQFTIIVEEVVTPMVRIRRADGSSQRIEIPDVDGNCQVSVDTLFSGPTSGQTHRVGDIVSLDEVLLLFACIAPDETARQGSLLRQFQGNIPTKTFTEADVKRAERRPLLSDPNTICPSGSIELLP